MDDYNRKLVLTHMWLRIFKRIIRSHWRLIGSTQVFLTETIYKKSIIQAIEQAVTPSSPFYDWYMQTDHKTKSHRRITQH